MELSIKQKNYRIKRDILKFEDNCLFIEIEGENPPYIKSIDTLTAIEFSKGDIEKAGFIAFFFEDYNVDVFYFHTDYLEHYSKLRINLLNLNKTA